MELIQVEQVNITDMEYRRKIFVLNPILVFMCHVSNTRDIERLADNMCYVFEQTLEKRNSKKALSKFHDKLKEDKSAVHTLFYANKLLKEWNY
jgi:hypothetical protein